MGRTRNGRWRPIGAFVAAAVGVAAAVLIGAGPAVAAPPTIAKVAAGYAHSCAVGTDATLWCWGSNWSGEVGDGTNVSRTTPTRVGTGTNWSKIDGGSSYTCAIRT